METELVSMMMIHLQRIVESLNPVLTEELVVQEGIGGIMITQSLRGGAFRSASISIIYNIAHLILGIRSAESILPPDVPAPSRGAPPGVLKRLAEEHRVGLKDLGEEDKETQCSVCIEDLSKSQQNIIKMPGCLHMFHQDCLFDWLGRRNSCPLCRSVPYE